MRSTISLIVNPLDSSSDLEAWESENGSLGGSAQTKTDLTTNNAADDPNLSISLKEEYYSSCEEENDESYSESESEQREDESNMSLGSTTTTNGGSVGAGGGGAGSAGATNTIKRFSGNCERIIEVLSEHDHTKNRKTYQVTKEQRNASSSGGGAGGGGSAVLQNTIVDEDDVFVGNGSPIAGPVVVVNKHLRVSESIDICQGSAAADDYLSSSSSAEAVESFVNELLEQAAAIEFDLDTMRSIDENDDDDDDDEELAAVEEYENEDEPFDDDEINVELAMATKRRPRRGTENIQRDAQKRLSATSKTSSDSNRSGVENNSVSVRRSNDVHNCDNDNDDGSGVPKLNGIVDATAAAAAAAAAQPSVRTPKETQQQINWNKAQESMETSKKNVEILRKNAALNFNLRRNVSQHTGLKRNLDGLHPFHTHMLLYHSVYDTKQVLYSFHTLRNIIACDCRTFLCLSITTSLSSNSPMKQLLVR